MLPWLLAVVAIGGFGLAFGARSPGLLALGLLGGFTGLLGAFLALAATRVSPTARGQSAREISLMLEARKLKSAAHPKPPSAARKPPPPATPALDHPQPSPTTPASGLNRLTATPATTRPMAATPGTKREVSTNPARRANSPPT